MSEVTVSIFQLDDIVSVKLGTIYLDIIITIAINIIITTTLFVLKNYRLHCTYDTYKDYLITVVCNISNDYILEFSNKHTIDLFVHILLQHVGDNDS